ncbi:hypothetical protein DIV28_32005, partial [Escherichia coli]|uniref:helix-turn-helix domain-containing protein n=1 Tax=Escherichia coli TaxID=562 RepID=UPI000DB4C9E0
MKRLQAFKFQLRPGGQQECEMRRFAGACRFVFNRALARQNDKKRGQNDAFRYPQGVKLDQENSRIFLPKLGWMRYRNSRQVTGVVKNVTVSQSCGKWYISIQTESEVSTPA